MIFQAGDSDEGREFAAAGRRRDLHPARHPRRGPGVLRRRQGPARPLRPHPRRAADPARRDLRARRHRRRGAEELAHEVRRQQVSGADRDQVPGAAVEPRPDRLRPGRPAARRSTRSSARTPIARGRASVRQYRDPLAIAERVARARPPPTTSSIRELVIEVTGTADLRRHRRPRSPTRSNDFVQADAGDGFILVPHITPGGLDEFADKVVPLLQERGVFRTEYEGTTLRDHLGLGPRSARTAAAPDLAGRRRGVMKFLAITLIVHAPDPVTGVQKSTQERFREVSTTPCWPRSSASTGSASGSGTSGRSSPPSPPVVLSHIAALTSTDPAVHRGHHAEPARPGARLRGLRHPRPPLRRPAGADHRQGQRRRPARAVPRHPRGPVGPQRRELRAVPAALARGQGHLDGPVPAGAARRRGLAAARCSSRSGSGTAAPPAGSRSTWPPATATRCSRPTSPTPSSRTPS